MPRKKKEIVYTGASPAKSVRAELAADLGYALSEINAALYARTRDALKVNRPGRKVPHYPFVPSHHHPDPI